MLGDMAPGSVLQQAQRACHSPGGSVMEPNGASSGTEDWWRSSACRGGMERKNNRGMAVNWWTWAQPQLLLLPSDRGSSCG